MSPKKIAAPGLAGQLAVKPGSTVHLKDWDPAATFGWTKDTAATRTAEDLVRLASLQERIWAERRHPVLVVLQGIDAAGKDGTIGHVMTALNPQGAPVTGFGVPTSTELAHDYLWRAHSAMPRKGEIGIFNRSYYEDVLVVRVHNLVPKQVWTRRFGQINDFERMLAQEGTTVVKFFLLIDHDEQRRRLQARYDDPTKRWKFKMTDLDERKLWDDYMTAFQDALGRCSTDTAPWYVIPANRKWFRNLAVSEILVDRLEALKPAYPISADLPPDLVIE